jgi:basic membrane protein A
MITPSGSSLAIALTLVLSIGASAVAAAPPRQSSRPPKVAAPARDSSPPLKIALLLSANGRGERSVNDAALAGLEAAWKRDRLLVAMRVALRPEAYAMTVDELAADASDLIIGVGADYTDAFRAAAARHPTRRFLLLDGELADIPNVKSVTFRGDEGSFLAGVVAAVESKRGRVGFVGGRDTPDVQAFECGWETGVRWATKERFLDVRGRAVYIGTTEEAFADPAAGEELSRAMIAQQGVDVLYAAAGSSGLGVIKAARQARVKVIGVDTDQRHVAPDAVVTSVRKRLDRAVETAIADVRRGSFAGGASVMNLANGGVDLVLPGRLAPSTVKLVNKARTGVVTGGIPPCVKEEDRVPAWNFPPRPMG